MTPQRPRKGKRPQRKRAKPETKPARRVSSTARGVANDDDVFIPKAVANADRVKGNPKRDRRPRSFPVTPSPADDDDGGVFLATPGRPVEVQSDWTDDATYADQLAEMGDGAVLTVLPDAESIAELGFVWDRRGVRGAVCKYGCDGILSDPPRVAGHHYSCPYWQREGATKTPF